MPQGWSFKLQKNLPTEGILRRETIHREKPHFPKTALHIPLHFRPSFAQKAVAQSDPGLALIVARWPRLPAGTKAAILALVRSVRGDRIRIKAEQKLRLSVVAPQSPVQTARSSVIRAIVSGQPILRRPIKLPAVRGTLSIRRLRPKSYPSL